ncbi:hypothetical protein Avbf_01989 [Armadillidium vulgare]|nr:hypothetical protein Avbf_01989 [Armadillidium vulgare]
MPCPNVVVPRPSRNLPESYECLRGILSTKNYDSHIVPGNHIGLFSSRLMVETIQVCDFIL